MDLDKMIKYMEHILRVSELKKYIQVLEEFKESNKEVSGYQRTIKSAKRVYIKQFWTWSKLDVIYRAGDLFTGLEYCAHFEKAFWFQMKKSIWRKHRSNFHNHVKYVHNDIVKPFRVSIFQSSKRVCKMKYLTKYLHHTYWNMEAINLIL